MHYLSTDGRHGDGEDDDDDYATEKLRSTDYDPEGGAGGGYRSTISGHQFVAEETSPAAATVIDFPRQQPHRCLGFYGGGRGVGSGRPLTPSGGGGVSSIGTPVRSFAVPFDGSRMHSLTYETNRFCGSGGGGGGGGGIPVAMGTHDSPPKAYYAESDPGKTVLVTVAT